MTDAVQVAMIVAIPSTLASVAAVIASIRNGSKVAKVEGKVDSVDHNLNHRLDQWREDTRKAIIAAVAEGRQKERDSNAAPATQGAPRATDG